MEVLDKIIKHMSKIYKQTQLWLCYSMDWLLFVKKKPKLLVGQKLIR